MNHKIILAALCMLIYVTESFAQRRENVYYFKNSGAKVTNVDSADYVRVISEPAEGSALFDVAEYYKNEQPKLKGKSSKIEPLEYEGTVITYYPSGKKQEIINYLNGKRNGEYFKYYPTGKIYVHNIYQQTERPGMDMMVMDCVDTAGNVKVKDGIGYYIGYDGDFKKIIDEGEIKAGLKSGKWKGTAGFDKTSMAYNEDYEEGRLLAGRSTDENGISYNYTNRYVQPSFKGGLAAFGRYLGDGIRYPQSARNRREEGKVIISFMVKPDGSLDGYKVLQNPNQQMTDEAIRILKISPKWVPGVFFGKVVPVWYTVPVSFKL